MKPEAAGYLGNARTHLVKARDFLERHSDEAARAAYLAGFNAAQALIFTRRGRIAKTHRGLRASFAELVRNEPAIDPDFVSFLGRSFTIKQVVDYGMDSETVVTEAEAQEMIDLAQRFVDCIAQILA